MVAIFGKTMVEGEPPPGRAVATAAASCGCSATARCVAVPPLPPVSPGPRLPLRPSARCGQYRTPAGRRRCPAVSPVRPALPPRRLHSLARRRPLPVPDLAHWMQALRPPARRVRLGVNRRLAAEVLDREDKRDTTGRNKRQQDHSVHRRGAHDVGTLARRHYTAFSSQVGTCSLLAQQRPSVGTIFSRLRACGALHFEGRLHGGSGLLRGTTVIILP